MIFEITISPYSHFIQYRLLSERKSIIILNSHIVLHKIHVPVNLFSCWRIPQTFTQGLLVLEMHFWYAWLSSFQNYRRFIYSISLVFIHSVLKMKIHGLKFREKKSSGQEIYHCATLMCPLGRRSSTFPNGELINGMGGGGRFMGLNQEESSVWGFQKLPCR